MLVNRSNTEHFHSKKNLNLETTSNEEVSSKEKISFFNASSEIKELDPNLIYTL